MGGFFLCNGESAFPGGGGAFRREDRMETTTPHRRKLRQISATSLARSSLFPRKGTTQSRRRRQGAAFGGRIERWMDGWKGGGERTMRIEGCARDKRLCRCFFFSYNWTARISGGHPAAIDRRPDGAGERRCLSPSDLNRTGRKESPGSHHRGDGGGGGEPREPGNREIPSRLWSSPPSGIWTAGRVRGGDALERGGRFPPPVVGKRASMVCGGGGVGGGI